MELQSYKDTLMAEVGVWDRIENECKSVFGAAAVEQDRDFLKLKLGEFERLAKRYDPATATIDDRAMLTVLNFQTRKLIKAIYPGLLGRLLHRVAKFMRPAIDGKREMAIAALYPYINRPLPVKETPALTPVQSETEALKKHQQQRLKHPGQQQRRFKRPKRGHSR